MNEDMACGATAIATAVGIKAGQSMRVDELQQRLRGRCGDFVNLAIRGFHEDCRQEVELRKFEQAQASRRVASRSMTALPTAMNDLFISLMGRRDSRAAMREENGASAMEGNKNSISLLPLQALL